MFNCLKMYSSFWVSLQASAPCSSTFLQTCSRVGRQRDLKRERCRVQQAHSIDAALLLCCDWSIEQLCCRPLLPPQFRVMPRDLPAPTCPSQVNNSASFHYVCEQSLILIIGGKKSLSSTTDACHTAKTSQHSPHFINVKWRMEMKWVFGFG